MQFGIAGEETVVIIDARSWEGTPEQFITIVKEAVNQWIKERPEGQRALQENGGTFTLLDLAPYVPDCFTAGTGLGKAVQARGINCFFMTTAPAVAVEQMCGVELETNLYNE